MKKLSLLLIRAYQKWVSPGLNSHLASGYGCRFSPSCSEYFYQAVEKYGILHGSFIFFRRLFRCRPGVAGGYDPLK